MTDKVTALNIIENAKEHYSDEELEDFYNSYHEDTLVMNKYLAIKASSTREGVLERVIKLQKDKVYDVKIPNLVRSLIGSFMGNSRYFHAKDGSGYRFVIDKIIEIDSINAQMASGLLKGFKLYKKMNHQNQELMRIELERLKETQGLSKNSFEILEKIITS
jgi:aminopeptidase N